MVGLSKPSTKFVVVSQDLGCKATAKQKQVISGGVPGESLLRQTGVGPSFGSHGEHVKAFGAVPTQKQLDSSWFWCCRAGLMD